MDWEERVLPSIGNEVVKAVVAQYNAEQLLTQREKVRHICRCCADGRRLCSRGSARHSMRQWRCGISYHVNSLEE